MAATQLNKLNYRHEAILNWLILNPDKTQNDCCAALNYTPAWLSQVINSDMFQAAYKERCAEVGIMAVHTINAQLAGVTSMVLTKTMEKVQTNPSERFLGDTLRTCLAGLGYSANPSGNGQSPVTVVNLTVNAQALAEARDKAASSKVGTTQAKLELVPRPEPAATPASDLDRLLEGMPS